MEFEWSEEQRDYRDSIVAFAQTQLGEGAGRPAGEPAFSRASWRRCAAMGIQGLPVPPAYGGSGAGAQTIVLALEGLGYGCRDNGLIFALGAQMWACEVPLIRFGSDAQRQSYLPGLCDGSLIGAQGMSEPEAGSDAFSMRATAERRPDSTFIINGRKTFVTNGPEADVLLIYASTDPGRGFAGVSAFLIERETAGLSVGSPVEKMGLRSSPMSEVLLEDCQVPAAQMLGKPGAGMAIFNVAMLWERSCLLASTVGAMEHQLERCVAYARSRKQFGQPIGKFQAVSHQIVDMKVRIETARMLVYRLAYLLEHGRAKPTDAALAKLYLSESYLQSSLAALQIHGGYGYMAELGLEREVRDAIATRIHSGTSEMQRNIIAAGLGL